MVFIDTSAFHAVLDADDQYHEAARATWTELLTGHRLLVTSNYIILETCALLQRRLGTGAIQTFRDDILPVVDVDWVTARQHENGFTAMVSANRRKLSLVDCVSFVVMRDRRAREAFTFDAHFREEGFDCNPR
jgi:predicted nucleic acid-binding protein